MALFGHFVDKKCGFLVMAAPNHLMICSNILQNRPFSLGQHPQNRVWGPTTDHSGTRSFVSGQKMAFYLAIFGQKMRFFGYGGSKVG